MTYQKNSTSGLPARPQRDHSWILYVWVLPLLIGGFLMILSGGLLAPFMGIAIGIGVIGSAFAIAGHNR